MLTHGGGPPTQASTDLISLCSSADCPSGSAKDRAPAGGGTAGSLCGGGSCEFVSPGVRSGGRHLYGRRRTPGEEKEEQKSRRSGNERDAAELGLIKNGAPPK